MVMEPQTPLYQDVTLTTADAIFNRLLATALEFNVPDALIVGSFEYDFLRMVSIELSQAADIPQRVYRRTVLALMSGSDLDDRADSVGVPPRTGATYAVGTGRWQGPVGMVVDVNKRISTNANPAIVYHATRAGTVGAGETFVDLPIVCETAGPSGNVDTNQITHIVDTIVGLTAVTNPLPTSGGFERESDASLMERISLKEKDPPASGNRSEVRGVALATTGVGGAEALYPGDGTPTIVPGTIRVTLIDVNHLPATPAIVEAVRDALSLVWRVYVEAESLTISGAGVSVDNTQTGAVGGSAVHMQANAAAGQITHANAHTQLPQGNIWELWLRAKRGAVAGTGTLLSVVPYDITAAAADHTAPLATDNATVNLTAASIPAGTYDLLYVGDFFYNPINHQEIRIIRPATGAGIDGTTDLWIDEIFYRSAMQRHDVPNIMPGGWRFYIQPAASVYIDVVVNVTYSPAFTDLAAVRAAIRSSVNTYIVGIPFGSGGPQQVQVSAVGDSIFRTAGVQAYDEPSFQVAGGQVNVTIQPEQVAVLRNLTVNGVAS